MTFPSAAGHLISLMGLQGSWPVSEIDAIIHNFIRHDSLLETRQESECVWQPRTQKHHNLEQTSLNCKADNTVLCKHDWGKNSFQ